MIDTSSIAVNSPEYVKRRILWKAVNRVRSNFVKRITNIWKRKLRAWLEDDEVMAINDAMRITYVEVGGRFARAQLRNLTRQKAFGDINNELDQRLANYSQIKLGNIIAKMKDTSKRMYLDILDDETLTLAQQADLIDEMINRRAVFLAQNEIVRASNVGQVEGMEAASTITNAQYVRTWIATIDDRVRDGHADADGQTVRGHQDFIVNGEALQFPKDPSGSAGNTINCRCVVDIQKLKI